MNKAFEYLSPEDIARELGLSVRTIRRYIREGRIRATKIGKQYRVTTDDFRDFAGAARGRSSERRTRRAVVSATTDITAVSPEQSHRITTMLTSAFGTASGRSGTHLQCLYAEGAGSLRIVVSGELEFTSAVLALINSLLVDVSENMQ